MPTCSTIVRGGWVLTATNPPIITDGGVLIQEGRIAEVGAFEPLRRRHPDARVEGGPEAIVMPGLINCHWHASEGLMVGVEDRKPLFEWIDRVIAPAGGVLDRRMARAGAALKALELALSGVTTVNDMFVCSPRPDDPVTPGVVDGVEDVGIRAIVSFGAQDRSGHPLEALLAEHDALAERASSSRRCTFRLAIATMPSASDALLESTARWLAQKACGLHIHLHEVREEVTASRMRFGLSSIERAAQLGLLDHPTLAAHCVWVSDHDIEVLAEHDVGVSHNPLANMILGSGICPVPRLRRAGIAVGIGTDGAASNDAQDMLEAMKMTSLLQKVSALDPAAFGAQEAFQMATIGGARALGLDHEIGSLEAGKRADLVVLTRKSLSLATIHDPFLGVVHAAGGREVRDVWVDGEKVVADGHPVRVDVSELIREAAARASELAQRAGFGPADRPPLDG